MQGQGRVYFYAISAVVIWSTLAAVAKSILTVIPTFEALFLSSLIASIFLVVQQGVRGGLQVFRAYDGRSYLAMAGLGFVGLFVYSGLYFYGLTQLTSQEACILNYLWPMMIVLFAALLLGERITLRTAAALLLSFSGVLVLTLGKEGRADGDAVLGALACVLAAVCYGLFCVLNRKRNADPTVLMMVAWGVTALCALPVTLMAETWVTLSWAQWGGMLWFGIFVNAVGYLWWAMALQQAQNAAMVANLAYFVPLLSLVVSAVMLGEAMSRAALLALFLIMGGILLQNVRRQER
ncbi:DMT family transporter [uncultured Selenomonas sp.]|uniref:DMT family transporter n=1 Tax=uncultured Selenomonas sp. TaxID=159275 RepID=UPI0028EB075F|nr:DMT family transporter [uncultured Selenomonas sp.]